MDAKFNDLYAKRAQELKASSIREICKLIADPKIISLAGGWPAPATFPVQETLDIFQQLLKNNSHLVLQYGTSEGLPQLREFMATWARENEQINNINPDNIIMTHGSQQGMDLAAKILIDPGDVVIVGLPTYFGGTGAFKSYGAELEGVPLDEDGMRMDILEEKLVALKKANKKVKFIYVQPNFHNPAGVTLSLERRRQLLQLADQFNFLILEDNPYGDLRYEGDWIPPLKALDTQHRVIYLRSFSKVFSPGIRLAWVVAELDVIRKMVIAKQFVDSCTNTMAQYIVFELCKRGYLNKQIKKNIAYYKRKRDFMLEVLEKYFPREVTWNRPQGGFFIFLTLPRFMDAEAIFQEAIASNVAFVAGKPFFIDGSGANTMRLSYAQSTEAEIETAIRKIVPIIQRRLNL